MTKVALVQPPASYNEQFNCLPTFQLGIGLLCLKDYLKQHGHQVRIFHIPWAQLDGIAAQMVFDQIESYDPQLIGVALNWLHFSDGAIETARRLRQAMKRSMIVIGGQHATLFAQEIMAAHGELFDALLHGEAERAALELARRLDAGEPLDASVPGVVIREGGSVVSTPPEVVEDLDSLPFFLPGETWPDYPTRFIGAPAAVRPILEQFGGRAALDTVRGRCPRRCSYCIASHIGELQGRAQMAAHSPEWLAEHVARLVAVGVNAITIQDPFFTLGDGPLITLCEELLRRGLNKKLANFDIFVEPGAYSAEALKVMSRVADVVVIEFGIETGSPGVAGSMGRLRDYGRVLEDLVAAREAGLIALSWWMVGLPSEGEAEIEETKAFIETTMRVGVIPAQVSPMVLFPHTRLAQEKERFGISLHLESFEDFSRFSREPLNEEGVFPRLITHESRQQSADDTLRHLVSIRELFVRRWNLLEEGCDDPRLRAYLERAKALLRYRFY